MAFSRRLTNFRCSATPRLLSSSSPIEESYTSSAVARGNNIIEKGTKKQKGENLNLIKTCFSKTQKTKQGKRKLFSFLVLILLFILCEVFFFSFVFFFFFDLEWFVRCVFEFLSVFFFLFSFLFCLLADLCLLLSFSVLVNVSAFLGVCVFPLFLCCTDLQLQAIKRRLLLYQLKIVIRFFCSKSWSFFSFLFSFPI